jgi:hypothetical protein
MGVGRSGHAVTPLQACAVAAEKASAASAPVGARVMVLWAEWLLTDFSNRRWSGCRASSIGIVTQVR